MKSSSLACAVRAEVRALVSGSGLGVKAEHASMMFAPPDTEARLMGGVHQLIPTLREPIMNRAHTFTAAKSRLMNSKYLLERGVLNYIKCNVVKLNQL